MIFTPNCHVSNRFLVPSPGKPNLMKEKGHPSLGKMKERFRTLTNRSKLFYEKGDLSYQRLSVVLFLLSSNANGADFIVLSNDKQFGP